MSNQYNWNRRWILPGTRDNQETNISALAQRWLSFGVKTSTVGFGLDELKNIPVIILLGEPGIGKSSEIRNYFEQTLKDDTLEIWRLQSYPPSNFLTFFNQTSFKKWHSGEKKLVIFIDSFDEGDDVTASLGRNLVEALESCENIANLRLRIACRTADWSEDTNIQLKNLFGQDNILNIELDALSQQEIVEALKTHDIDTYSFLEQVEEKALAALTLKPITLIDLIKEFQLSNKKLPNTRNELYAKMCKRMCEEDSPYHDATDRRGQFTVESLLNEAARLAAIMVISRHLSIWLPSSTKNCPESAIPVEHLHSGSTDEERLTRAVLHTGLFSSRGANQLGWAHLSYAEYLAAIYLNSKMTITQVKNLLLHPIGTKLIPQLREVAAWLTSMNPAFLKFVMELDSESLLESELIVEDSQVREQLTTTLLDLYHREILIEIPFNTKPRYKRLNHPNLAQQLIEFVHDETKNLVSRDVAISIIYACEVKSAADSLIDLVLDPELEYEIRSHATYTLADIGSTEIKPYLKPLLFNKALDVGDQLKGVALRALWPETLTTKEFFDAITPSNNKYFGGTYLASLHSEMIDHIPEADLPMALDWAAFYIENFTDDHHHLDSGVQDLIDKIVYRSWFCFHIANVSTNFARVMLAKAINYQALFGYERRAKLDEPFQKIIDELITNHIKRREILLLVLKLIENLNFNYWILENDIPLLIESDFEWLIDLLRNHSINENQGLELIKAVFSHWNPRHMNIMSEEIEKIPILRETFEKWFYVRIGSQYASDLQNAYRRNLEREAKYKEIETHRQRQLIDPPPLERLVAVIDECEKGDIAEWWRTNTWLATNEYGQHRDWYADLRQMPNWDVIDHSTREKIISLGIKYLFVKEPEREQWLGQHRFWRPELAAYRILFLLFDINADIPIEIISKWIPSIVTFPAHFVQTEYGNHKEFLAMIYNLDPHGFRTSLEDFLDYWHKDPIELSIVENYFSRFDKFFDNELAQILITYLDNPNIKRMHYDGILNYLLQKSLPSACSRAAVELQRLYKNHLTLLHQIPLFAFLNADQPASKVQLVRFIRRKIIEISKQRNESARIAANLIASPIHDDWWYSIWELMRSDEDFGRKIIEITSELYEDRRLAKIGSQLSEAETAEFYLWVVNQYPHEGDAKHYGGEVYAVTSRDYVADWRDGLLNQLAERGTPDALIQLERIAQIYPKLYQVKRLRKYLIEYLHKQTWYPPKVHEILALFENIERRYIQTDRQLLEVVIESLDRLQRRLHGETPSAVDLWNIVPKGMCRPKDENALSNYIKRHLEQDLRERGIVIGREVEIRRKEGGDGAALGEVPDLRITAIAIDNKNSLQEQLTLLVEVKCNWHDELRTAAKTQLVERYLSDNDKAICGLYLVGWFNCKQWDIKDSRRAVAMRLDFDSIRDELNTQAVSLSTDSLEIRTYLLDTSLRDA